MVSPAGVCVDSEIPYLARPGYPSPGSITTKSSNHTTLILPYYYHIIIKLIF